MASRATCLILSASSAFLAVAEYPPGFPCSLPPKILLTKGTDGWPGACLGLKNVESSSTAAECKKACLDHTRCDVWQLTDADECWISDDDNKAYSCWGRQNETSFEAKAAERIQHGRVNRTNTIDQRALYPNLYYVGVFAVDTVKQEKRCERECYSDIYCTVWQYVRGEPTDPEDTKKVAQGCYVETKANTAGTVGQTANGQTVVGEQIQHVCAEEAKPPPTDDTWKIIGMLIGLALLLALIACVIFHVCCAKPVKEKPKTTRAIKVAPKKTPEVAQPLMVVQQPMVAYAAAPTVSTSVVTPTYQAVPQAATYTAVPQVAPQPLAQSVAAVPTVTTAQFVPQMVAERPAPLA